MLHFLEEILSEFPGIILGGISGKIIFLEGITKQNRKIVTLVHEIENDTEVMKRT